jgi:uncharacterized protein (DUF58 family)
LTDPPYRIRAAAAIPVPNRSATSARSSAHTSWASSGHARRLLTLALAGLVIAVTARRAEFAATAGPALLLLATWRHDRPRTVWVSAALKAGRMIEGENGSVGVSVAGYGSHTVELRIHPAAAILPGGPGHIGPPGHGSIAGRAGSIRAGGVRAGDAKADGVEAEDSRAGAGRASVPFLAAHWGNRPVGTLEIILRDRWRLSEGRALIPLPRVDCYPLPAHQDARVVLSRLPSRLGEHAARVPGEGTEFAGVREFVPGDRQRRINWPATTRRGSLQLNTFAAERAQNVVVVADATADIGDPGSTTLDLVHRGAAATIRAYLAGMTGSASSATAATSAGSPPAPAVASSTGSWTRCWPRPAGRLGPAG